MAGKLGARNSEEVLAKQIMIEGVLAIQGGENPNVIRERLMGFLPPAERKEKIKKRKVGLGWQTIMRAARHQHQTGSLRLPI